MYYHPLLLLYLASTSLAVPVSLKPSGATPDTALSRHQVLDGHPILHYGGQAVMAAVRASPVTTLASIQLPSSASDQSSASQLRPKHRQRMHSSEPPSIDAADAIWMDEMEMQRSVPVHYDDEKIVSTLIDSTKRTLADAVHVVRSLYRRSTEKVKVPSQYEFELPLEREWEGVAGSGQGEGSSEGPLSAQLTRGWSSRYIVGAPFCLVRGSFWDLF